MKTADLKWNKDTQQMYVGKREKWIKQIYLLNMFNKVFNIFLAYCVLYCILFCWITIHSFWLRNEKEKENHERWSIPKLRYRNTFWAMGKNSRMTKITDNSLGIKFGRKEQKKEEKK